MLPIKRIKQTAAIVISAAMAAVFGTAGYYSSKLPDHIVTSAGSSVTFAAYPEIRCSDGATLSLFGAIPVKTVTVQDIAHDRRGLRTYYRLNYDLMVDVVWLLAIIAVILVKDGSAIFR